MVQIYSTSNSGIPIGRVADYNNTDSSRTITKFRELTPSQNPLSISLKKQPNFASAIYGNGPYSLLHPNQTSEILAQNIDFIA